MEKAIKEKTCNALLLIVEGIIQYSLAVSFDVLAGLGSPSLIVLLVR